MIYIKVKRSICCLNIILILLFLVEKHLFQLKLLKKELQFALMMNIYKKQNSQLKLLKKELQFALMMNIYKKQNSQLKL